MEATLLLATIAQRYRLRQVEPQTIERLPALTMRPKGGLLMVLEARA